MYDLDFQLSSISCRESVRGVFGRERKKYQFQGNRTRGFLGNGELQTSTESGICRNPFSNGKRKMVQFILSQIKSLIWARAYGKECSCPFCNCWGFRLVGHSGKRSKITTKKEKYSAEQQKILFVLCYCILFSSLFPLSLFLLSLSFLELGSFELLDRM